MLIKRQALEDGTIRKLVGYIDDQTGHEEYTYVDPQKLLKLSPILARVEINCIEQRSGFEQAEALLEDLLREVRERLAASRFDALPLDA